MQPNIPISSRQGKVRAENQQLVYNVFEENDKLTIAQATELVNTKSEDPITSRTVRRAVEGLVKLGFLATFPRVGNSILYGKADSSTQTDAIEKSVPFGSGNSVTPAEFFQRMVGEDSKPLQIRADILNRELENKVRREMAFVLYSTGNSGFNSKLEAIRKNHEVLLTELRYVADIVETFLSSPMWYTQYRDMLAKQVRDVERDNPELIQLARDFIRGGNQNNE